MAKDKQKQETVEERTPPKLFVRDENGNDIFDLPASIIATMYFPMEEDKHDAFRYWLSRKSWTTHYCHEGKNGQVSLPSKMFRKLMSVQSIKDLGVKEDKIIRNGILCAHWLHFRIWATKHQPNMNHSGKWNAYLGDILLPSLRKIYGKTNHLPIFGNRHAAIQYRQMATIRKGHFAVAHFWAAACHQQGFDKIVPTTARELEIYRKSLIHDGSYKSIFDFLSLAESYRQEATQCGIYDRMSIGNANDVWLIQKSPRIQTKEVANSMPNGLPVHDSWDTFLDKFTPDDEK